VITVRSGCIEIEGLSERDRPAGLDLIRQAEAASIRQFVEAHRDCLRGRVLDFGAGKPGTCRQPQPYRDLVDKDAEYLPHDRGDELPKRPFDAILCTQVLQYIEAPRVLLRIFRYALNRSGRLVLTYPTNWDEVEGGDYWRFTRAGMDWLLREAGFTVQVHERRAEVKLGAFTFPLGYGVVAQA
jgi:SAM-dependent methyltransferase